MSLILLPIELIIEIASKNHVAFNLLARALPLFGRLTLPIPGTRETQSRDFRLLFKTTDCSGYTYLCGVLHSFDDLPAVKLVHGDKYWYKNGELHRDNNLPAIEYASGDKHYYQHGSLYKVYQHNN